MLSLEPTGKTFTVTVKPNGDGRHYIEVRGDNDILRQRPLAPGERSTYTFGDAARRAESIARGLRALGHEVTVTNEQQEAQAA